MYVRNNEANHIFLRNSVSLETIKALKFPFGDVEVKKVDKHGPYELSFVCFKYAVYVYKTSKIINILEIYYKYVRNILYYKLEIYYKYIINYI